MHTCDVDRAFFCRSVNRTHHFESHISSYLLLQDILLAAGLRVVDPAISLFNNDLQDLKLSTCRKIPKMQMCMQNASCQSCKVNQSDGMVDPGV